MIQIQDPIVYDPSCLKPCPFCGGPADVWDEDVYYPGQIDRKVGCPKCKIGFYNDFDEGVKKWNRRVNE